MSTASGLGWVKLWWAGSAPVTWLLGTGTGVFALLYLPAFAWWLGSTAYRMTVPAVLYLIQARKLRELEATFEANALGEE